MANRLLPFRQYNEHFVINLFRLKLESETIAGFKADNGSSGNHDAGLLVKVSDADWAKSEPAGYDVASAEATVLDGYLGASKSNFPHVAANSYPAAQPMFQVAGATERPLGVTLRQTLAFDENGEKLLYYRQKLEDLYGVLPGEVVPVLTKGIITIAKSACVEALVAGPVYCGAGGKFTKEAGSEDSSNQQVGTVIGIGDRDDVFDGSKSPDYFADDGSDGAYYIINLDL
jgi:hypothetical protein